MIQKIGMFERRKKMKGDENFTRHRFSVPKADVSVQEWIQNQYNLSVSLRMLIKDYIRVNGTTDVTCAAVEQRGKVGRPSNAELARRAEEQEVANNAIPQPVAEQPVQVTQHAGAQVAQPVAPVETSAPKSAPQPVVQAVPQVETTSAPNADSSKAEDMNEETLRALKTMLI